MFWLDSMSHPAWGRPQVLGRIPYILGSWNNAASSTFNVQQFISQVGGDHLKNDKRNIENLVRNWINHGILSMWKEGTLKKTTVSFVIKDSFYVLLLGKLVMMFLVLQCVFMYKIIHALCNMQYVFDNFAKFSILRKLENT